jgi:hypothetical protein
LGKGWEIPKKNKEGEENETTLAKNNLQHLSPPMGDA